MKPVIATCRAVAGTARGRSALPEISFDCHDSVFAKGVSSNLLMSKMISAFPLWGNRSANALMSAHALTAQPETMTTTQTAMHPLARDHLMNAPDWMRPKD